MKHLFPKVAIAVMVIVSAVAIAHSSRHAGSSPAPAVPTVEYTNADEPPDEPGCDIPSDNSEQMSPERAQQQCDNLHRDMTQFSNQLPNCWHFGTKDGHK